MAEKAKQPAEGPEDKFSRLWGEYAIHNRLNPACLPIRQFQFAKLALGRKWAADFCWTDKRLIVEIQGGVWVGGRHNTGAGYTADCYRLMAAQALGYRVLYVTPGMITLKNWGALADVIAGFLLEPEKLPLDKLRLVV